MKRRKVVNPTATADRDEHCIYGVHAVAEWVHVNPARLREVHYDARAVHRVKEVIALAQARGVSVGAKPQEVLTSIAGTTHHQGLVARVAPFPYVTIEQVMARAPRLLVLADQIQDPHNLGALLRTAEAAGSGAVIIPRDGAVRVTATVEISAAGAAALVPVCRVTNSARTLAALRDVGYWSVGLVPSATVDLYRFDPPDRITLVLGGESGMRPLVARHCDFVVSIPMFGRVESLNAAVAAAVALYELRRRWRERGRLDTNGPVV